MLSPDVPGNTTHTTYGMSSCFGWHLALAGDHDRHSKARCELEKRTRPNSVHEKRVKMVCYPPRVFMEVMNSEERSDSNPQQTLSIAISVGFEPRIYAVGNKCFLISRFKQLTGISEYSPP